MLARLAVALVVGALIGAEREALGKLAGVRTNALTCLGSAVFTVVGAYGFPRLAAFGPDPTRVAAQIVSGIGFLGAAAIVRRGPNVEGITTAATLWLVAGLGMAAGAGAYGVVAGGTVLALLALYPLRVAGRPLRARNRALAIHAGAVATAVILQKLRELGVAVRSYERDGDVLIVQAVTPPRFRALAIPAELAALGATSTTLPPRWVSNRCQPRRSRHRRTRA